MTINYGGTMGPLAALGQFAQLYVLAQNEEIRTHVNENKKGHNHHDSTNRPKSAQKELLKSK
jgi:hypothetical protein